MDIKAKVSGIQHVGIPTNDIQKSMLFYKDLGFEVIWQTVNEQNGESVAFLRLGNLTMEVYENKQAVMKPGAIDHIALDVTDIDSIFSIMKRNRAWLISWTNRCLPDIPVLKYLRWPKMWQALMHISKVIKQGCPSKRLRLDVKSKMRKAAMQGNLKQNTGFKAFSELLW